MKGIDLEVNELYLFGRWHAVLVIVHLYIRKHSASSKHTHDLRDSHKQIPLIELGAMTLSAKTRLQITPFKYELKEHDRTPSLYTGCLGVGKILEYNSNNYTADDIC